jgi:hypothetical protein
MVIRTTIQRLIFKIKNQQRFLFRHKSTYFCQNIWILSRDPVPLKIVYNEQLSVSGLGYGIDNRGSFATRSCCILAKKTKHISRFAWYRLQINKKGAIYLTIGNARQLIMRQYIEALNSEQSSARRHCEWKKSAESNNCFINHVLNMVCTMVEGKKG